MKLEETATWMLSTDYKDRFKAEYAQTAIRHKKLDGLLKKWDMDVLDFKPLCPRSAYDIQIAAMKQYLAILETRAVIEGIDISEIQAHLRG